MGCFAPQKYGAKRYNYPPEALDMLFEAHLASADRICMLAEAMSVGRGAQTSWLYGRDALDGAWNMAIQQLEERGRLAPLVGSR